MADYCLSEIPAKYWVNILMHKCENCGKIFELQYPSGDELVKFKSKDTLHIRWIPTYSKGGYLDLFSKLNPQYKGDLTEPVVKEFLRELNRHIELASPSDSFELDHYQANCIYCSSTKVKLLSEEVLTNPKLDWLKISCELIDQ